MMMAFSSSNVVSRSSGKALLTAFKRIGKLNLSVCMKSASILVAWSVTTLVIPRVAFGKGEKRERAAFVRRNFCFRPRIPGRG
ncbi:hypothetical protein CEXT_787741 [Caerostris extrusa]|uniref:Uncharacterized protein n=1 Tax=Caerostris extrusa TaxID=172846 RepID=A0AAV4MQW2_CAEEX|nr:hypothetical protein CEXT_787741 [Caerostris extrusa]